MQDADRQQFAKLLTATFEVYQAHLTPDAIGVWWSALQRYPLEAVRSGLSAHVTDAQRGRFAPKPADVIHQLSGSDGRLGADEAWARCPLDETRSVVWSDEISKAYFAGAYDLLVAGDRIAARMAFKDAYERIVEENRRIGNAPRTLISFGHALGGREDALRRAVEEGTVSIEYAQRLLPQVIDWPEPRKSDTPLIGSVS